MKEALSSSETRFLQEPHGVISQKTTFFIVTAVKTSNLTRVVLSLVELGPSKTKRDRGEKEGGKVVKDYIWGRVQDIISHAFKAPRQRPLVLFIQALPTTGIIFIAKFDVISGGLR
jgi:hypothetical protein